MRTVLTYMLCVRYNLKTTGMLADYINDTFSQNELMWHPICGYWGKRWQVFRREETFRDYVIQDLQDEFGVDLPR